MFERPPYLKIAITALALGCSLVSARTFTDASGRTMEAEIVEYTGGDKVTILRDDGKQFTIPLNRLSDADQEFVRNWTPPAPKEVDADEIKQMNELLGVELFTDGNLWDDNAAEVAKRLDWPQESKTQSQSSFRKYNGEDDRILSARPHSSALYGQDGKVDMISIVFANKGDSAGNAFAMSKKQIKEAVKTAVEADGKTLEQKLATLGPAEQQTTAAGRSMKERLQRWDWNGHAILLAVQDEEYVALRIMPTKLADNRGRPERVATSELKSAAKANVEERGNGDVIIRNIPMVNQGPKGYCVPATLERTLRYMGIRADMYLLAMAGETAIGGGTYASDLVEGTERYVKSAGRKLEDVNVRLKASAIAKYIDQGQPVMWGMYSTTEYNALVNAFTSSRKQFATAKEWKDELKDKLKDVDDLEADREMGHMCLIVGYNEETDEIAVTDSWGPEFEERWIPAQQASKVSQGSFWVVDF
ncbi:MAG: C39 family peptidase [Verrucomicrobiota bacterium]